MIRRAWGITRLRAELPEC